MALATGEDAFRALFYGASLANEAVKKSVGQDKNPMKRSYLNVCLPGRLCGELCSKQ